MRRLSGLVATAATTALIAAPLTVGAGSASAAGLDDLTITGLTATGAIATYTDGDFGATTVGTPEIGDAQTLQGIDYRPATDQLYGLSVNEDNDNAFVVRINDETGEVTAREKLWNFTNDRVKLTNGSYSIDFNPMVDRLRIVGDGGQNLRVNVDTGLTLVDAKVRYTNGRASSVTGIAYNNNRPAAAATKLFDLESLNDRLVQQNPPNDGVLVGIAPVDLDVDTQTGLDIYSPQADKGGRLIVSTPGLLSTTLTMIAPKTGNTGAIGTVAGTTFVDIAVPTDQ